MLCNDSPSLGPELVPENATKSDTGPNCLKSRYAYNFRKLLFIATRQRNLFMCTFYFPWPELLPIASPAPKVNRPYDHSFKKMIYTACMLTLHGLKCWLVQKFKLELVMNHKFICLDLQNEPCDATKRIVRLSTHIDVISQIIFFHLPKSFFKCAC